MQGIVVLAERDDEQVRAAKNLQAAKIACGQASEGEILRLHCRACCSSLRAVLR